MEITTSNSIRVKPERLGINFILDRIYTKIKKNYWVLLRQKDPPASKLAQTVQVGEAVQPDGAVPESITKVPFPAQLVIAMEERV